MKKIFLIVLASSLIITITKAQDTKSTFAKNDNVIGLGFGIGGVYGFSGYSSQTPTFGAQYDRGIAELDMGGVIGVGGFIGYKGYVNSFTYFGQTYKDKYNIVIIGARGTFHYDLFKVKNLDTYGGMMIAFHIVNNKSNYPDVVQSDTHSSAAYASIYAGAKYYFSPQFAAFAELGYGVSWLTLGASLKF